MHSSSLSPEPPSDAPLRHRGSYLRAGSMLLHKCWWQRAEQRQLSPHVPKKSSKCATTTSSELAACNLPYLTTSCTLPPNVTFPPRLEKSYWKNPGWILLYDALQRAKFTSHKPACITNASPSTTPRSCLIADENLGFPTPSLPGWCLSCIFQPSRSEWVVRNVL